MTGNPDVQAVALALYNARRQRLALGDGVPRISPLNLLQAQAVQAHLIARYLAEGQRPVGFKLGLTDTRLQAAMGLESPLLGPLLADWQIHDAQLDTGSFLSPRVEMEVAFVFAKAIPDGNVDEAGLMDALAGVTCAMEICDSAYAGWPQSLAEAVADNLSFGGFILGKQLLPADPAALAGLAAELRNRGQVVAEGSGANCMGSPFHACRWLVQQQARAGNPVQAGDIVLSGALGPMLPVHPGDRLSLEMGYLGSLQCDIH